MRVLLINGSPRPAGCTYTALAEVGTALHADGIEGEIFHLGTDPVRGCIDCGACQATSRCIFNDDGANALIEAILRSDGIVVGSPVYYAGPNGALLALLDRAFYAAGDSFAGKPAAAIVNCRRAGSTAALDRLYKYFTISRMPVASSQYWNMTHGFTPEDVRRDAEGMQIMRTLGHEMAWMLKGLAAKKRPEAEPPEMTNFIR